MSPELTYTLLGAIIPAIGWVGREFWKSLKEARAGKKAEADRIADERDKYRSLKLKWKEACYATRQVAIKHGASLDDLPKTPDD